MSIPAIVFLVALCTANAANETAAAGPVVNGKEVTCDSEDGYMGPILDNMKSSINGYKSCNEETQKYTLEVSGYDTELQAGKNGNVNKYGIGMMCKEGNLHYIITEDTEQATWDALKASPPPQDKVLLACLLKEGSSGGGGGDDGSTTSPAMHATVGMAAVTGAFLLASYL